MPRNFKEFLFPRFNFLRFLENLRLFKFCSHSGVKMNFFFLDSLPSDFSFHTDFIVEKINKYKKEGARERERHTKGKKRKKRSRKSFCDLWWWIFFCLYAVYISDKTVKIACIWDILSPLYDLFCKKICWNYRQYGDTRRVIEIISR